MTTTRPSITPVLLAVALVAVAAFVPTFAAGRAANHIPVASVGDGDALTDPTAAAWDDLDSADVPLASAPSSVPDAGETSVTQLDVRAAYTDTKLYIRLSWADETADRAATSPRSFADAAAVQFPLNRTARPAIAMGSENSPVNVWYWNAETGVEELLAGGPGTTMEFDSPAVKTTTTHENGRWYVVYTRDVAAASDDRAAITTNRDVDIAFAVWDGQNMERSGRKAVSEWHQLMLGPGPQGPPYEAILWAVAGIAILVVVRTTIVAVREE